MYLTAHRVFSRRDGREGINAFFHIHGAPLGGAMDMARIVHIADEEPGELVEQRWDLHPGGNAVRSYLDVVAEDATMAATIHQALDDFGRQLADPNIVLPRLDIFRGVVGIRFGANVGLWPQRQNEFAALRQRIEELLCQRAVRPQPA